LLVEYDIMWEEFLNSWWQSVRDPAEAQEIVLRKLLSLYQQTEYGKQYGADGISSLEDFRSCFPIVTYKDLKPLIAAIMEGNFAALLSEPPVEWVASRGNAGKCKLVPVTRTDLELRLNCNSRALLNCIHRCQSYDTLLGWNLDLSLPSVAGKKLTPDGEIAYGYASGIYAKYEAGRLEINRVPAQGDIEVLGGGVTPNDWEKRFHLAYESARDKNVKVVTGDAEILIQFASYLKKRRKRYPRDLWDIDVLVCGNVADIHTKYAPALKALYGDVIITEKYEGAEGVYAQQLDEQPYVVPNYDAYLFEVEIGWETKMLHQLKPGQYGSLIVSSPVLPRYKVGDLIRCMGESHYCVIGKERRFALIKHLLSRLLDF